MPTPRSRTSTSTIAPARRAPSRTSLPGGEYFTALETRLDRMRWSASGSASTRGSAGAQSTTIGLLAPRRKSSAVAASTGSTAGDAALELLGEPPLARREARVFQRHRDVRTQRLERPALVAAELADPLDGEHADMLTGHEERRGDDAARAAAAPSVGDEHRRPGGEHARGQRALGHAVATRDHQALTVTHDQPNVGDPQTLDERGAEASE